jgi:hypothetical protein
MTSVGLISDLLMQVLAQKCSLMCDNFFDPSSLRISSVGVLQMRHSGRHSVCSCESLFASWGCAIRPSPSHEHTVSLIVQQGELRKDLIISSGFCTYCRYWLMPLAAISVLWHCFGEAAEIHFPTRKLTRFLLRL